MRYVQIMVIAIVIAMIPAQAFASGDRQETGDGGELRFAAGATVLGAFLEFDNNGGQVKNCVVINSERGGRVISGVINPFLEEISKMNLCFGDPAPAAQPSTDANATNLYETTGVRVTKTFTVYVPQDWVLVIGGYVVDGLGGGTYKAVAGPRPVNTTVTDGFIQRVHKDIARDVFCSFVNGSRNRGNAVGAVLGLPGWQSC